MFTSVLEGTVEILVTRAVRSWALLGCSQSVGSVKKGDGRTVHGDQIVIVARLYILCVFISDELSSNNINIGVSKGNPQTRRRLIGRRKEKYDKSL